MVEGLTPKQAAEYAGMHLNYFRTVMSRLNKTSWDLRLPPVRNERFRRYDEKKLAQWLKKGRPVPEVKVGGSVQSAYEHALRVNAKAQRAEGGESWVLRAADPAIIVESSTYAKALTLLRSQVARTHNVEEEFISIDVELDMPAEVKSLYERRAELQKTIQQLQAELQTVQHELVPALRDMGWSVMDITVATGYSRVWVEQLLKAERPKAAEEPRQKDPWGNSSP